MEVWITAKEKAALEARGRVPRPNRDVLEAAGLSAEEVALVELFYECPTPSGVPDSVRYAVWALSYLPQAERLSPAIYYSKTRADWDTSASQIAHWLGAAECALEEEKGEEPRLFGVLRKLLAWCQEYEKQHPYSQEYTPRPDRRGRQKAESPGSAQVVVEAPAPEVTVRVIGEQMRLL